MSDSVRIAGIEPQSIVDGPGLRYVVFTQGCPHACPGCHNPQSHDFSGGYDHPVSTMLEDIRRNPLLKGITLSGGEPLCRAGELLPLVRSVRELGLDVFCYSGYTWEQLAELARRDPDIRELLSLLDVLIDGPYLQARRNLTLRFRGSDNQRVLDVPRSLAEGKPVEAALDD